VRLVSFTHAGTRGVGILRPDHIRGRLATDPQFPGDLDRLIKTGKIRECEAGLWAGHAYAEQSVQFRPPLARPNKIICVGLNYRDHTSESGYAQPDYPTFFLRLNTSLLAHRMPIVRPRVSEALDFEGELVAVIGRPGRHIAKPDALSHVAGYSLFNDASIRDYQHRTPQWTVGKNFDRTGAFGPAFVTADELPPGARGLHIETRLNGVVVQSSNTDQMIFDVATLVATVSEVMTLLPGDVLVTGTPSGVGHSRTPKLYMKPGDRVEVEVEKLGVLSNTIVDEGTPEALGQVEQDDLDGAPPAQEQEIA
jgi:acylpyruvate hydrolase